jgi:hypothetical protein
LGEHQHQAFGEIGLRDRLEQIAGKSDIGEHLAVGTLP